MSSNNPLDAARELKNIVAKVYKSIPMAEAPKKRVATVYQMVEKIIKELEDIHTNVVPLELKETRPGAGKLWEDAPDGLFLHDSPHHKALLAHSVTLKVLYKSAIDVLSMYKFSIEEIQLSNKVAAFFGEDYNLFKQFRMMLTGRKGTDNFLQTTVENAQQANHFLHEMAGYGIIGKHYAIQLYTYKDEKWVDSSIETLKRLKSQNNPVRFQIELMDAQNYRDLVDGHWFNAFAYSVITDHLQRTKIPHEIFTRVSYRAPLDIFKAEGDFDVLAMAGRTLLLVECKSGNLQENEVDKIIDKKNGLQKVFETVTSGYYNYVFLLVYNPHARNDTAVFDKLQNASVRPLKPDEIRASVIEIFRQNEMPRKNASALKDALRLSNSPTFLDALVSGCALIAAADGQVSESEKQAMMNYIQRSEEFQALDTAEVVKRFQRYLDNFSFNFMIGKAEALKAIGRIKGNTEAGSLLIRVCIAIGMADGDFDPKEKSVLAEVCRELGIDPVKFPELSLSK